MPLHASGASRESGSRMFECLGRSFISVVVYNHTGREFLIRARFKF